MGFAHGTAIGQRRPANAEQRKRNVYSLNGRTDKESAFRCPLANPQISVKPVTDSQGFQMAGRRVSYNPPRFSSGSSRLSMLPARSESTLLHELIAVAAARSPDAPALVSGSRTLSFEALAREVGAFACGVIGLNVGRGERIGIYLEKRPETVVASFGAPAAGAVFVPLNPLLKPHQVAYIVRDCSVRVLVTSCDRLKLLEPVLSSCPDLRHVVVVDDAGELPRSHADRVSSLAPTASSAGQSRPPRDRHRCRGDLVHVGKHRQPEGRGALPSKHGVWCQERRELPPESLGRHAAGCAPALVRRRLQSAHDRVSRRCSGRCCSTTCCRAT